MESEIADMVVFFRGSDDFQLFKDISIDGEVPCHDKCCVEDCELDHNNISSLLKHELDKTTDVSEEVMLYISTGVQESFSNHHYCLKDDAKLCGAQSKLMEAKPGFGDGGSSSSSDNISNDHDEPFKSQDVDNTSGKITKFSLFQLLNITNDDDLGFGQQNRKDDIGEAISAHFPHASGQKGDYNISKPIDSRLEMDLEAESLKNEEETPESANGDNTLKKPLLLSSSTLSHQNTPQFADIIGSSGFSGANTSSGSGRLTFSGSMLGCDNVSLRSNSTTSTTSFAFPILATEWNESPIRMAEADKRRRRRSQRSACWGMCFSCSDS